MCPRSRLATLAGDTLQCSLNLRRQLLIDRHQVVSPPGGPKAPLQERVERLTTSLSSESILSCTYLAQVSARFCELRCAGRRRQKEKAEAPMTREDAEYDLQRVL